jgi:hypothetical protein
MNATEILEPAKCSACGSEVRPPADGRWRWARGAKVHESIEAAQARAAQLTTLKDGWEFRAEFDALGRPRIASRRTR